MLCDTNKMADKPKHVYINALYLRNVGPKNDGWSVKTMQPLALRETWSLSERGNRLMVKRSDYQLTNPQCKYFSIGSHRNAKCIDGRLAPHIKSTIPEKSSRLPNDAAGAERFHITWQLYDRHWYMVFHSSRRHVLPSRAREAKRDSRKIEDEQERVNGLGVVDLLVDVCVEMIRKPCKQEGADRVRVDIDFRESARLVVVR